MVTKNTQRMKTIEIATSRVKTIEMGRADLNELWRLFKHYSDLGGSPYLMNALEILGMGNGNSGLVEMTINDLVVSVFNHQLRLLTKWNRERFAKYSKEELSLINKFQKTLRS